MGVENIRVMYTIFLGVQNCEDVELVERLEIRVFQSDPTREGSDYR